MVFGCGSRALRRLQQRPSGWLPGSTAAVVFRDGFQGLRRRRSSGMASRVLGGGGLQGSWL